MIWIIVQKMNIKIMKKNYQFQNYLKEKLILLKMVIVKLYKNIIRSNK